MNLHRPNHFARATRCLGALLGLLFFLTASHAEPAGDGRWLLIFETSSVMKKNLPATEAALKHFLITSANGELAAGDSVAVWTFDREVNGKFPTFTWSADAAAMNTTNVVNFLEKQHYRTDPKLEILQTPINHVVVGSRQLTIILFCDGQSDISGTPYDQGINQTFHDAQAERKKNRQPFVVVLRSQFGKIIDCTVNFPPGGLNLPAFPPPPAPPTNSPAAVRPAATATPAATVPDLVIVGTKVGTNLDALLKSIPPTNKPVNKPPAPPAPVAPPVKAVTNTPPSKLAEVQPSTNRATLLATNLPAVTASTTVPMVETNVLTVAKTNAPAVVETNVLAAAVAAPPDQPAKNLIHLGIGLLVAAALLVLILLLRPRRRPQASLITSSMQDPTPRRK
ncbi:MAG TPA: hypothetical protein VGO57_14715 [Verrucomicrobiae bacterium]